MKKILPCLGLMSLIACNSNESSNDNITITNTLPAPALYHIVLYKLTRTIPAITPKVSRYMMVIYTKAPVTMAKANW